MLNLAIIEQLHLLPLLPMQATYTSVKALSTACRQWQGCVLRASEIHTVFTQTFFLILPRIWHSLFTPSMHIASKRPLPSMRRTCAYSAAAGPAIMLLMPAAFIYQGLRFHLQNFTEFQSKCLPCMHVQERVAYAVHPP